MKPNGGPASCGAGCLAGGGRAMPLAAATSRFARLARCALSCPCLLSCTCLQDMDTGAGQTEVKG